ncbi:unnamed protein product [Cylindrotheca closterium]|uniref:Uncharacterized protein n=1 Tax=Cylindrotheca closterium TaxID=2856 RepID=A0AAD2FWS7_9STRA|nr:unnamed protein product [Cylindrotheca closterium]
MVAQSPAEQQFSWNALISNFVGKHDGSEASKASETEEPKLEMELEEGRSESNEGMSLSEARDDADCSQPLAACTPFDEPTCVPFDERSCTPRTSAEMKMDLNSIREDIAEIVKEHKRQTENGREAGESQKQEKCVHFSLDCNPEAVASKEERKKPVMDRKDDTLDYIFNLVEIAICGDKKSNIDEEVTKRPTKREQMPDPVQLLREKSIFQTLNPGGTSSNSKKHSSRPYKSGETTSDKIVTEDSPSLAKSATKENPEASTSETSETAMSKNEDSTTDDTTLQVSKPQVSTIEARELRSLRLKAASTISMPEDATLIPNTSKPEVPTPTVSTTPSNKISKTQEAVSVSTSGFGASTIAVPPTIPEEPSNSQESASSQGAEDEETKKFVEEVAMEVLAEAQALAAEAAEADAVNADTDTSFSNAPQSSVHVDASHDSVSLITDVDEYSHSLPRIIHLSNSEANQTKLAKPSNVYSPSIRKLQNRKSVSSALAAYNKKVKRSINFGGSTHILGKQGPTTTTLARRNNADEQVIQLLAGLLSMGESGNISAPGTPRGVIFLASVVSFLFWPEDLPQKQQMARKTKPAPVEEPAEKKEPPSLLSLVGDKKPKRTSSPMKRNRPRRPQLSARRMNASQKKSFDV